MAESHGRRNLAGANGGDGRGRQHSGCEQQNHRADCQRIGWRDPEEGSGKGAAERPCANGTNHHSREPPDETLLDDQARNIRAGCAQRGADPDLFRPLLNGIGHQPVQTDCRQNQSDGRKRWNIPHGNSRSTGNTAFDEYREATLKRLEEERGEFAKFLERLRLAKDKDEFDRFMSEQAVQRSQE